jgi:Protein of unknown function, DUF547
MTIGRHCRNHALSIFSGAALLITILAVFIAPSQAFSSSTELYKNVLSLYVKDGFVDYSRLKSSPGDLNDYLAQSTMVTRKEFDNWTRDEQLAFLVNLYNARTLRLVIEHYPVKSIRDIGGAKGPWEEPIVHLFGEIITLNALEGLIRNNYNDPRAHFALVCAAKGCPPLLGEPYSAENLNNQLESQTQKFLADPAKNSIDVKNKIIWLSPIFKWYMSDFSRTAGSVQNFMKPYYLNSSVEEFKIEYTYYDWSLNDSSAERK